MNPIETLITLKQLESIYKTQFIFGKVIDLEMQELYNTCCFKEEALSGGLRIFPRWMQEKHSSRLM